MRDRTLQTVTRQLRAMGVERFDLGIRAEDGGFMRRENRTVAEVLAIVPWLRRQNAQREHVYIRPAGERHPLVLLDDLELPALEQLLEDGLPPAAAVETSRGNYQVWLRHVEDLDAAERGRLARAMAEKYNADLSSTDASHFGRLAGFTNPKPEYRDEGGRAPFVLLRSSRGVACKLPIPPAPPPAPAGPFSPRGGEAVPLAEYHRDPRFGGDLHRADLAWACQAAQVGMTEDDIVAGILLGRDLSKKGSESRRRDYATRTARKACSQPHLPPLRGGESGGGG